MQLVPLTIRDRTLLATNSTSVSTSLCIVQDDEEDRYKQVAAMDRIYESAKLVAASGHDAEVGLPGVRFNSWCSN